jgi:hypothetical protein
MDFDDISGDEPSSTEATTSGTAVRQIAVFLPNEVGSLLAIVKLLNGNQVVVLGLSVQDSVDVTIVRMVVSDPDTVESLFMEKGIAYSVADLLVVELQPGIDDRGLADCLQALLLAETNIHFIYPVLSRPNDRPALAMHVEDSEFGRNVLEKNGFRVLLQEDLSR